MTYSPISGSGGRSPKKYKPTTAKDTLDSTQYLQCIDLISEGEIEGFPTDHPYKSIYLDGTPIMRSSANVAALTAADYNFPDIGISVNYGTGSQPPIPGFSSVERENSVGVDFTENNTPVTRTITDSNTNAVRVTLNWQRLERYTDKGDTLDHRVYWEVLISYNGGPFSVVFIEDLTGRSGNPFQRYAVIPLNGAFPVDVRVNGGNLTPSDNKIQNAFTWSSYTEIVYANLSYPYRAVVALRTPASTFSSLPVRSYRVRGIKVSIPSNATVNYTDGSITYSGVWNGTFQAARWTTDPTWILYDLVTSRRYGLGDHISTSDVDKWATYTASVYANQRVPTGVGDATEPRFSCHANINSLNGAYKLVNDLASVCRCMPYWSAGGITLVQDKPGDVVAIFTQSNIVNGEFSYSSSSKTQRHTVASVSWLDRDRQELSYEFVEDRDGIARYGVQKIDVDGFACSSRSQARRIGLTILATERYETDVVTFSVGLDSGALVRPGAIIAIEDTVRSSGARYAGRIVSGTLGTVTLDVTTASLPSISTPTVLVAMVNGTVASRTVSSTSGSTLTLSSNLPALPLPGGAYIYNDTLSKWRVLSVKDSGATTYEITALQYNESRYASVDRYIPLGEYTIGTKVQYATQVGTCTVALQPKQISSAYSQAQYVTVGTSRLSVASSTINSAYSQQLTTQVLTAYLTTSLSDVASSYSQTKYTPVGRAAIMLTASPATLT
jgi:predicted phage tail protein